MRWGRDTGAQRTQRLNSLAIALQILEYVAQCIIVVTLLLAGKWFCGALHIGMLAYMVHSLVKRQHVVDATDVFKQLPAQKKKRFIMFGFFLATLVIVMYRWGRRGASLSPGGGGGRGG